MSVRDIQVLIANLKEEKADFALLIGSYDKETMNSTYGLASAIDEHFHAKPAIRATILQNLYCNGIFDEWVNGYGVVCAIDIARYEEIDAALKSARV